MNSQNRKYRKTINKNGWMARLYKYTTGKQPSFVGYCPFFWTTWFFVLTFPFVWLSKQVESGYAFLKDYRYKKRELEYRKEEKAYPTPSHHQLWEFYSHLLQRNIKEGHESLIGLFYNTKYWCKENPHWRETHLPQAIKYIENQKIEEELKEAKYQLKSKKKQELANYLRKFIKPVVIVSILIAAYYTYKIFFWVLSKVTWSGVLDFVQFVGGGMLSASLIILGISSIFYTIRLVSIKIKSIPTPPEAQKYEKPNIFRRFFGGLVEGVGFIYETIKMAYTKECPLIEWAEKDEPIKKNEEFKK